MICKLCCIKASDNPDETCDDYKFCMLDDKDISPNI
jgi:hypothetical protein